jgi:[acyl-carrier-protein] S-malonyltransferase
VGVASVAVVHNVDAARAATPEAIRAALARQAASPVRWVETIRAFATQGVTHIIECGPGTVLTGLARRIAPDVEILPLNDAGAIAAAIAATAA